MLLWEIFEAVCVGFAVTTVVLVLLHEAKVIK